MVRPSIDSWNLSTSCFKPSSLSYYILFYHFTLDGYQFSALTYDKYDHYIENQNYSWYYEVRHPIFQVLLDLSITISRLNLEVYLTLK